MDEQIIPFRGQLSIKQYVKGKPTPWGVKIFVLCGASGQMYDFIIYQGSQTNLNNDNIKKYGFGAAVILDLSQTIPNIGHKLYYDNYFSNYNLLQILKRKNISAAGTVKVNRFSNPPLLSDKEMKKRGKGAVARPEIVKLYNKNMGGVDLLDQMVANYRIYIRSKKWTLRMIFHAIDLAVVNSWFEYKKRL